MNCEACGSTELEEVNGLYYCVYCQTQSQGFIQELSEKYEKTFTREVKQKRIKRKAERKVGFLWTTTEAFNIILFKQMNQLLEINGIDIDVNSLKRLLSLIWFSYLRSIDMGFRDNEIDINGEQLPQRLHPSARFRDEQIFKMKVENHLPKYRNGSSQVGFKYKIRLSDDAIIRRAEQKDSLNVFDYVKNDSENNCDFNDIYYNKYNDPRIYAKIQEKQMNISKESLKILRTMLAKIDCQLPNELLNETNDVLIPEINTSNIDRDSNELNENTLLESDDSLSSEESDHLSDWFEKDESYNDLDKELLRNSTERTKLFAKHIPLSYMKDSRNNKSNYFIESMSLPKTLSILNIVLRLLNSDIYCFDLIRWSSEGHISYLNCLSCFPDDWEIISNDLKTFTSSCVPSANNINYLSAKIANLIKIKSFPKPDLKALLKRFVKDFNLPKDIVNIIERDYNLFEHFPQKLGLKSRRKNGQMDCLPFYERWTLMAIVIVLKRIFILDDTTERRLSESVKNENNIFIWNDWEKYTRLRLELIKSYFIPLYGRNIEEIRDIDVITEHTLKRTEYEMQKSIFTLRKGRYHERDFRIDIKGEFERYCGETQYSSIHLPSPSLYPLISATDFALTRIDSNSIASQLSVSFEDKLITPWICAHQNTFHRSYNGLNFANLNNKFQNEDNFSSSFKLLLEMSCVVLHTRFEDLCLILKQMEKIYFGI